MLTDVMSLCFWQVTGAGSGIGLNVSSATPNTNRQRTDATLTNACTDTRVHVVLCFSCPQVALVYAGRASKLVLVDRDAAALEASKLKCEEAGAASVLCLTVDVTDFAAVQAMHASAMSTFGKLDVLVLCAGIGAHHLFDATPELSIFRKLMDVNFYGYLHCVRAAYKTLCESNGTLIAVTSFSGEVGLPYRTAYCASKFAVVRRGGDGRRSAMKIAVGSFFLFADCRCLCRLSSPSQTGFLESLRSEMSVTSPANSFHITIVCPPTVNTNLRRNALTPDANLKEAPSAHAMTVADCAAAIVDAGDRKLRKAFFPFNSWLASYLRPIIPDAMDKLIMKRAKL